MAEAAGHRRAASRKRAQRPPHPIGMAAVRSATLGSQAVRYVVTGSPGAPRTLLLFNGIGAGVETLAPFIAGFEQTRVVAFDVPGVGGSPTPVLPYGMHDVAGLAAKLLDHLGVDRADVFGVSWGGAAAQEFAIHHPERCRTLTLAATSVGAVMVPGPAQALLNLFGAQAGLGPAGVLQAGGAVCSAILGLQRDVLALHARADRAPNTPGYLYQLLAVWGWTSWHRLHRVHAPTLVLMGNDDPIVPPVNGRIVAALLRRATLECIDCGHLFVHTRPVETARRVERFMTDHPRDVQDPRPGDVRGAAGGRLLGTARGAQCSTTPQSSDVDP